MAETARQTAYRILMRCRKNGAWSENTISSEISRAKLDGRDAALCSRIVLGVLQNRALLDFYIAGYCATPIHKLDPQVLDILRLSAYQLTQMDKIPASAAVNEGVRLCKENGLSRASGLVNAVLRKLADHRENLPEVPGKGTAAYLATKYSHPLWLVEEYVAAYGYDFAEAALGANNETPPVYAQSNPLRPMDLTEGLSAYDPRPTEVPGCYVLKSSAGIAETEAFRQGGFYIQDLAAKLSAMVAGAAPGMTVLDVCAAPGGKSMAAAMAMNNEGRIISCDIHEKKLRLIRENGERLGVTILETRAMDARTPEEDLRGIADIVIADVPCSGLGVIRRKPEIREKSPEELDRLPEIQRAILEGEAACVKPGGVLLYSTCTVRQRENEDVVRDFLSRHGEFSLEPFELPLGIGEVSAGMFTFWPHLHGTDGFFVCKMRKTV